MILRGQGRVLYYSRCSRGPLCLLSRPTGGGKRRDTEDSLVPRSFRKKKSGDTTLDLSPRFCSFIGVTIAGFGTVLPLFRLVNIPRPSISFCPAPDAPTAQLFAVNSSGINRCDCAVDSPPPLPRTFPLAVTKIKEHYLLIHTSTPGNFTLLSP